MDHFLPPFPPRFLKSPALWKRLIIGHQNFLAMWGEKSFEKDFLSTRIFARCAFICNSPEAVQFALNLKSASFERKAPQMRYALEPLLGDGLFISDGETWRSRRRIIAPLLHSGRVHHYAPTMVQAALDLRQAWARLASPNVDAVKEMAQLTAEIISRTLFGRSLGASRACAIVDGFSDYQGSVGQLDLLSFFGLPDWIPRFHGPAVRRARRCIHAVLDDIIEECRVSGTGTSPINELLVANKGESEPLLDPQAARNESAVLFMAGHETTANALAWTWYLLSQAPDVEARMHHELDQVLRGRPPMLADLPRLPFTRAVLDESMRLYPPVPLLPREALREESYQGHVISKGSLVLVVPWLLHRHKKLWDEPDHFVPERFLPDRARNIPKYAYLPFGIGPRICAGMSFALTEAILCLATLAQAFTMRLAPGHEVKPVCRLTLRPQGGLPMTLHRRALA